MSLLNILLGDWSYRRRSPELESNEHVKQVVAYVTLRKGRHRAWYSRPAKGGDARLASKYAIGFGGHVNDVDATVAQDFDFGLEAGPHPLCVASVAAERELMEEVGLGHSALDSMHLIGFVNDESDAVGRVHLGLVFEAIIRRDKEPRAIDGVHEFGWADRELMPTFNGEVWESWSKLIIDREARDYRLDPTGITAGSMPTRWIPQGV